MMDHIEVLPHVTLDPSAPFGAAFLKKKVTTLIDAARYLKEMDYGHPPSRSLEDALEAGVGTCYHKHGILASCAREVGVPVQKALGIYPMDSSLVPSVAAVLSSCGLSYVPATHCFLVYGAYRVDLTEKNCNGKTGPIDSYFYIEIVPPDLSEDAEREIYRLFMEKEWLRFCGTEGAVGVGVGGKIDFNRAWTLLEKCGESMKLGIGCHLAR